MGYYCRKRKRLGGSVNQPPGGRWEVEESVEGKLLVNQGERIGDILNTL
jgi:hypothetical protein